MRFAITGSDRHRGVLEAFVQAGWEPIKLFSNPTDERIDFKRQLVARARALKLDIQISPMTAHDLADLGRRGCDALVVAGYDWRIGDWRPHLRYALNFHPSPLPEGRGPYPAVRALLEQRSTWGVSCHQVEREFDAGAVLARDDFPLGADESLDSLDLKIQIAVNRLAQRVARNLDALWNAAVPQAEGSYWRLWSDAERTLDFRQPVAAIMRQVRAFGSLEVQAQVNGGLVHVRRAVGWIEAHAQTPGSVVHIGTPRALVVAAGDGFIGLIEWSPVSLAAAANVGR